MQFASASAINEDVTKINWLGKFEDISGKVL